MKHCYNSNPALEIDEFTIFQGAAVGLIGPNGSGKSTFLELLGFINRPSSGKIFFKGEPAGPFSESVRFRVTLLPQNSHLMKRTVFRNVAYGLKIRKDREDHRERVHEALDMVGLPPGMFAGRRWHELSGGEARRVALAARLVLKPEVLLLDEPTTGVDAASIQLIKDASMRARREWGTTLVIASHDLQWLYEVCDDILHLFRGCPAGSGNESILLGPWLPREDGLWEKPLGNGRSIAVTEPPDENAAAVVSSHNIAVELSCGGNADGTCFEGVVSRLILEKRTGLIIATILVGNLPITAKLTREKICEMRLCPGMHVNVHYSPDSIKWL